MVFAWGETHAVSYRTLLYRKIMLIFRDSHLFLSNSSVKTVLSKFWVCDSNTLKFVVFLYLFFSFRANDSATRTYFQSQSLPERYCVLFYSSLARRSFNFGHRPSPISFFYFCFMWRISSLIRHSFLNHLFYPSLHLLHTATKVLVKHQQATVLILELISSAPILLYIIIERYGPRRPNAWLPIPRHIFYSVSWLPIL